MRFYHYHKDRFSLTTLRSIDDEGLRQLVGQLATRTAPSGNRLHGRLPILTTRLAAWGSIVVKTYARGGLIRYINPHHYMRWGPVRAQREFNWLLKLHALGFPVPHPLAYVSQGRFFYRTWLVTAWIENKGTLARLSRQNGRLAEALLPQVQATIDQFCRQRILHVDLHPGNIIVTNDDQIRIIDWDKARRSSSNYYALLARYHKRWNRAIEKHGLPETIRLLVKKPRTNARLSRICAPDNVRPQETVSILIVLMGSIGDVIRGLAVASELKKHLPHSRLTWLVEPKCLEVVRWHRQIDEILVFRRNIPIRGVCRLIRQLVSREFDIVLDMQRHIKSGVFALLANAPTRVGFHRCNAKEFNWLFNNQSIPPLPADGPKQDQYMAFCTHLGLPPAHELDFGLRYIPAARSTPDGRQNLPPGFIALVVGSSRKSKDWPVQGYRRLIALLQQKYGLLIVLLGTAAQMGTARQIEGESNSAEVIDLVGRTSLYELVRLLKAAAVAVGPDSGPGHLAAAVGTPYIALFGPTAARRVAPYGCSHLVVQAPLPCAPCAESNCPEGHNDCMRSISAEMVEARVAQVLQVID
jgi:lipopolysaccharide heptosyltransferase I